MLDEYLEKARTHYARGIAEGGAGAGILELLSVWQPAWGTGPHTEVVLCNASLTTTD